MDKRDACPTSRATRRKSVPLVRFWPFRTMDKRDACPTSRATRRKSVPLVRFWPFRPMDKRGTLVLRPAVLVGKASRLSAFGRSDRWTSGSLVLRRVVLVGKASRLSAFEPRPGMQTMIRFGTLLLILPGLTGCGETPHAPYPLEVTSNTPFAVETDQYDRTATGQIRGRVEWNGPHPEKASYYYPTLFPGELSLQQPLRNPLRPAFPNTTIWRMWLSTCAALIHDVHGPGTSPRCKSKFKTSRCE